MKRYPILFDWQSGALGFYVDKKTDGYSQPGCVHILMIPFGDVFGKVRTIMNVPKESITPPLHSHHPEIPGVRAEGYVFINVGCHTPESIVGQAGMFLEKQIKVLHDSRLAAETDAAIKTEQVKTLSEGAKEDFKRLAEREQALQGTKPRRRMPGEDDGNY